MPPEVPADLCATVPASTRQGLATSASSDPEGNPTAACSLRSTVGDEPQVSAVVTWMQNNDEASADEVLASQCRAIDRQSYREQPDFSVAGADDACGASGKVDGTDSATIAAVSGLQVVTVRYGSLPAGRSPALTRAREMAEGVLAELSRS
jgi:hypothetical protein